MQFLYLIPAVWTTVPYTIWPITYNIQQLQPLDNSVPLFDASDEVSSGYSIASRDLQAALNFSVDPCTDFFEYSCGNWIANNPIPNHLTEFGNFQKLIEKVDYDMKELYELREISTSNAINKARQIFAACMDEQEIDRIGTSEMRNEMALMGYWPIVHGSKWDAGSYDLTDLLIKVAQSRGINLFFDSTPGTDIKNNTRRVLQFDQGSLGLGDGTRDYYMDQKKFAKQITAYRNLLIQRATQVTMDAGLSLDNVKIASDVEDVLNFETRFAEITVPEDERRNFSELYHNRRFHDLNNLMPIFNWKKFFLSTTPFSIYSYLNANPEIIISEPAFFDRLTALLNSTNPETITNYVMFRFMANFNLQLGTVYENIDQEFAREMYGRKERSPRWKDCVTYANSAMNYASGSMYVRKYFDSNSKDTTLAMIADIQAVFKEMLKGNDWMDDETKVFAQEKADQMQKFMGYPDLILADEKLDEWYKKFDVRPTDSFNRIVSKSVRFFTDYYFNRLLEPVDRTEFKTNAATVNAFYSPLNNAITFPAAILQVPFFHPSYPKALNYGGIGAVIGHEITHGFDDAGSQFDAVGNLRNWWNDKTSQRYLERTECVIEQYGNITVPSIDLNINGKLTQGENVADNGGVKEAFKAYKQFLAKNGPEKKIPGFEKFTNEQMFYIGYAQTWCGHATPENQIRNLLSNPHSPGRYRVNVVLQNQPEFAAAFNCPASSPMNPEKRCSVW